MDEAKEIVFEFLSDDPQEADGFAGRGHERSARALANAIVKFSEDDRSIGLEGNWGSGKTTVVTIAEGELAESFPEKFSFFTFDLWANQSVEFRRAFLEEFLVWSKPYMPNASAYKSVERCVQGKTKTVETESSREYSIFGYLLMTALFFLPFLVLWLSPLSANFHRSVVGVDAPATAGNPETASDLAAVEPQMPVIFQLLQDYGHWAAVTLIGLVAAGFVGQTIYLWITKGTFRSALDTTFSLFARKSDKDTVTQTIRDGDPTQYEFHQIFTEILTLVQGTGRRVVFVFDNIDRLPADQIQETWSSVRSIFSRDSCRNKDASAVVTAVVPYDRAHVLSAFDDSGDAENAADEPKSYALEDVFRKTFSAVVTVAPPVTSDVEFFFGKCLESALPAQFDDGQKYRLFQIFDVFLTERSTNPTPRQVKSFVNDVGMLWFQWQGAISIEAIAVFVLHRSKLEADPRNLQNPDTIHARYRHFAPTQKLDSELAALAYNVEPDVALEVLLERDITAALRNPKSERLQELAKSPGFKQQLDRILMQQCSDWASTSLQDFEAALTNYTGLALDTSVKVLCDRHFTDALPKLAKLDVLSWQDHKSLFQIAGCMPASSVSRHMKAIADWLGRNLPEKRTQQLGRAWVKFVGGFIEEIQKTHGEAVAKSAVSAINVPYAPEFYLGVALDCDEAELHFSQMANVAQSKSAEIAEALATFADENPTIFSFVWNELQFALKSTEKAELFEKLFQKMQASIMSEDEGDRQAYLENLVLIAALCRGEASVAASIKAGLIDGTLPWHASKSNEGEDWKGVSRALWLAHLTLKTGTVPALSTSNKPPFGDVSVAHKWFSECYAGGVPGDSLQNLAEIIMEHDTLDGWFNAFVASPKNVLYHDVLIEAFALETCPPLRLVSLLDGYTVLKARFQGSAIAAMVERVGKSATAEEIDKVELTTIAPVFVQDIAESAVDTWVALLERVDKHLKSISSAEWEEALANDNHNRQLLFARGDYLNGVIPPNHLRAPLPLNKRWRFGRDAMKKFADEETFLARQLTDTQYLSRLAHEYMAALYPDEEPDAWGELTRKNHVRVITGRMTEMLRRQWGLNSILADHNQKNRNDHRHHAIDAAVVGVTTRALLQRIATAASTREALALEETIGKIDPPWPGFRDDLKAVIERIVVSHKPDHGTLPRKGQMGQTAGQLHNDTAYGLTDDVDRRGNPIVVRRKPFLSLTDRDVPNIRDAELRARLHAAIAGSKDFGTALLAFKENDLKFGGIRHVRLTEGLKVIAIRDAAGRAYKGYKGDANYRYDVWEMPDEKWLAKVVTLFDAHQPDFDWSSLRPHPAARRILFLQQGDMVAYDHPRDGETIGVVVKFGQNGQITLVPHTASGDLKRRDALPNTEEEAIARGVRDRNGDPVFDPFKYFAPTAGGLKKINLRKLHVDEIGAVRQLKRRGAEG